MAPFLATEPNYILVGTSSLFLVPCLLAYLQGQYMTSQICSAIAITSMQFHGNPTFLSFYLDQIAIGLLAANSIYLLSFLSVYAYMGAVGLSLYAAYVYAGPHADQLAYHPDPIIASLWHGSIHGGVAGALSLATLYIAECTA
jgi:hypothetical protein